LEFENIKRFTWWHDPEICLANEPKMIAVALLIELDKPCNSRKKNFLTGHG